MTIGLQASPRIESPLAAHWLLKVLVLAHNLPHSAWPSQSWLPVELIW